MSSKPAAALGLGLAAAVLVLAASAGGLLEEVELTTYDWRIRQVADPSSVHPDIAIVLIDDQTIRDMEPLFGRWPWPRAAYSLFFTYLHRAPARVVAFDVGIWERQTSDSIIAGRRWSGQESDQALVDAVRESGTAVFLADAVTASPPGQQNKPAEWRDPGYELGTLAEPRPSLLPPFQDLSDATLALGHNFLVLDPDGPARRLPPFVRIGDRALPSLGVAAAMHGGGFGREEVHEEGRTIRIRDRLLPLTSTRVLDSAEAKTSHDQHTLLINYRADERTRSYPTYEARFLIQSELQLQDGQIPSLDPALFRNRIVFIGASAAGTFDVFPTPFGSGVMPGVQIHATVADSILSNRFIRQAPGWTRIAGVLVCASGAALLALGLSYRLGATAAALLAAAWFGVGLLLFQRGVWLNLAEPIAAAGLALFAGTAYRYFVEDREKRKVKRLFGRYVSRDVYEQLLAHPEQAELGGQRRQMSVLFSDIRGFTSVTENGDPEALVAQLNEYFGRMVDVVFRHQGTVDKFVGDMVMALFGAPLDDERHAEHAVNAAVDMVRELEALNRKWVSEGRAQLDIGIGINSGEMIAGNIGSSSIMSYTVIGDNVNLGARLESLNKEYGTRIIISEATRAHLRGGAFDVVPLGDVVVKGKTRPVVIYEVKAPSPGPAIIEEAKS